MVSQSGLGSMVQIKAQGPQNEYVNGSPSMSPFIHLYKRYFNFSRFQKLTPIYEAAYGKKLIYNINPDAHGDLLSEIIFTTTLMDLPSDHRDWYTLIVGI